MGRVADATVPGPRRSDDAIAVATARSSNNGDGAVPPQPFNLYGHVIHVRGHPSGSLSLFRHACELPPGRQLLIDPLDEWVERPLKLGLQLP